MQSALEESEQVPQAKQCIIIDFCMHYIVLPRIKCPLFIVILFFTHVD